MATLSTGVHTLLVSNLSEPSPLPIFQWQQPIALQDASPSSQLSPEEINNSFFWGMASILPYQVQDDYDRAQKPDEMEAVFVENDLLKLTLYPQYGGRLASIVHKPDGRELLFNNPAFQPANLAALNAWFSGGIEWNGLIPGHTPFTCSPVFTAIVKTDNGPILRLYEFDRIREATWQVDLYLPDGETRLWVHVKIINPNSYPINCYWWTNVAAPLTKGTRVLSPADYGIEHVLPDNHLAPFPFPHAHGFDGSYPANYGDSTSVFFRKPGQKRPWIAAFQEEGLGIFHISTPTLPARKLFAWGSNPGGRRWMDFLSTPGNGDYIEIQSGVAPTQNQEFILAANQTIEWTECIAPLAIEPERGHNPDYQAACQAMETHIRRQVPDQVLAETDGWLQVQASRPVSDLLSPGRAWGMLYEKMTGLSISTGLTFDTLPSSEALWADLVDTGSFSAETLSKDPQSWAVSQRWVDRLEQSSAQHGTTWLHELLQGVAKLDRGEPQGARQHFERSIQLKENYLAYRHLALILQQQNDVVAATDFYLMAWAESNQNMYLAVEFCLFCQKEQLASTLATFLAQLPDAISQHERIRLAQAEVALEEGDYASVRTILDNGFATIREGETLLTDLWFALHRGEAEASKGSSLTEAEIAAVLAKNPPPHSIDFRMKTEQRYIHD